MPFITICVNKGLYHRIRNRSVIFLGWRERWEVCCHFLTTTRICRKQICSDRFVEQYEDNRGKVKSVTRTLKRKSHTTTWWFYSYGIQDCWNLYNGLGFNFSNDLMSLKRELDKVGYRMFIVERCYSIYNFRGELLLSKASCILKCYLDNNSLS